MLSKNYFDKRKTDTSRICKFNTFITDVPVNIEDGNYVILEKYMIPVLL